MSTTLDDVLAKTAQAQATIDQLIAENQKLRSQINLPPDAQEKLDTIMRNIEASRAKAQDVLAAENPTAPVTILPQ